MIALDFIRDYFDEIMRTVQVGAVLLLAVCAGKAVGWMLGGGA